MPSIINGLIAGRQGISSHGAAIAVVGDNISNSSTPGFKAARAEFEDIIAGGQAEGRVVGSGSQTSAVSTIFQQGTMEFTGRTLDLAVDGNGFFAVQDSTGQKFYTRAGNFKVDTSGNIINQNGLEVLGYPAGGSGSLEPININTVSQANIATNTVTVSGNVDAGSDILASGAGSIPVAPLPGGTDAATPVTFDRLNSAAAFSTVVDVFDTLGASHTVTIFFFHTAASTFIARAYVTAEDVGDTPSTAGLPRQVTISGGTTPASGSVTLNFDADGSRSGTLTSPDITFVIPWGNGSDDTKTIGLDLNDFTQYASPSAVKTVSQDGQGIGNVSSLAIDKDGSIFAKLSNGQSATIGELGLVNFSNPEGLTRVGANLLQQSPVSGEPLVGRAQTGTFGAISSGSIELSTVDIATEFVKLITLQRGFQANSKIITSINELLSAIIQLA